MIDAHELRIGNYLQSGKGIYKVISVSLHESLMDIITISEDGIVIPYPTIYSPIEITEDLILKLGYSPCTFTNNYFNADGHRIWKCNDFFVCDKNGVILNHVHKLQNLYFALNGKELTLNQ